MSLSATLENRQIFLRHLSCSQYRILNGPITQPNCSKIFSILAFSSFVLLLLRLFATRY